MDSGKTPAWTKDQIIEVARLLGNDTTWFDSWLVSSLMKEYGREKLNSMRSHVLTGGAMEDGPLECAKLPSKSAPHPEMTSRPVTDFDRDFDPDFLIKNHRETISRLARAGYDWGSMFGLFRELMKFPLPQGDGSSDQSKESDQSLTALVADCDDLSENLQKAQKTISEIHDLLAKTRYTDRLVFQAFERALASVNATTGAATEALCGDPPKA